MFFRRNPLQKLINTRSKRNRYFGFDKQSKIHTFRQVFLKTLGTKIISKIFCSRENKAFARKLGKINRGPKYYADSRPKIRISGYPLQGKPTKGNPHHPRSKIACGCENKATFDELYCQGSSTSEKSICQHNIFAPQERGNFLTNKKFVVVKPIFSLSKIQNARSGTETEMT